MASHIDYLQAVIDSLNQEKKQHTTAVMNVKQAAEALIKQQSTPASGTAEPVQKP